MRKPQRSESLDIAEAFEEMNAFTAEQIQEELQFQMEEREAAERYPAYMVDTDVFCDEDPYDPGDYSDPSEDYYFQGAMNDLIEDWDVLLDRLFPMEKRIES